jgi:hypothetical protein
MKPAEESVSAVKLRPLRLFNFLLNHKGPKFFDIILRAKANLDQFLQNASLKLL